MVDVVVPSVTTIKIKKLIKDANLQNASQSYNIETYK